MNNIELLEKYKDYTLDNIEHLILMMKENRLSMMQSTMLLVLKFNLSIKVADNYILNSVAWQNNKECVEKLRNNISDSIDKLTIIFKKEEIKNGNTKKSNIANFSHYDVMLC